MKQNLPQSVLKYIPKLDSNIFNKEVYDVTGVFVVRNLIPQDTVAHWQDLWTDFYNTVLISNRKVNQANPVVLTEQPSGELSTLYRTPELIELAKQVHGQDVALFNHRFVIKDTHNRNKVFLHQDSCYHLGNLNKCSFFIPIFHAGPHNGGLEFYPGTHKYGYLGDAGEINPNAFQDKWTKVAPDLYPGDVAIMNSHTWHESPPNTSQDDRIVVDIITQPADDPTGAELLAGEWRTELRYSKDNPIQYFSNSRVLKIKKFTES
jgi:hypothetical protein